MTTGARTSSAGVPYTAEGGFVEEKRPERIIESVSILASWEHLPLPAKKARRAQSSPGMKSSRKGSDGRLLFEGSRCRREREERRAVSACASGAASTRARREGGCR